MIGILRNTLCYVGTARYATNNPAKYLPSTLNTRKNNSLLLMKTNYSNESQNQHNTQAEKKPTNFWTTIRAAVKKIPIFADEEVKTSEIGRFKGSLSGSKVRLVTPRKNKTLIFPATFSTKLNGKPIEPESNKIADEQAQKSFKLDKWNVSLDSGKLTLKLEDSGETFILKHTVYAEAVEKSPGISETGGVIQTLPTFDSNILNFPSEIIADHKGKKDSKPTDKPKDSGQVEDNSRKFQPVSSSMPIELLRHYGHDISESLKRPATNKISDTPDDFGRMKLSFPMTVLLKGGSQEIKTTDNLNTLTVYHLVTIEAEKIGENSNDDIDLSRIGILQIELESGDLIIELPDSSHQSIIMRQEVDIEINLHHKLEYVGILPIKIRALPTILVRPVIKILENY